MEPSSFRVLLFDSSLLPPFSSSSEVFGIRSGASSVISSSGDISTIDSPASSRRAYSSSMGNLRCEEFSTKQPTSGGGGDPSHGGFSHSFSNSEDPVAQGHGQHSLPWNDSDVAAALLLQPVPSSDSDLSPRRVSVVGGYLGIDHTEMRRRRRYHRHPSQEQPSPVVPDVSNGGVSIGQRRPSHECRTPQSRGGLYTSSHHREVAEACGNAHIPLGVPMHSGCYWDDSHLVLEPRKAFEVPSRKPMKTKGGNSPLYSHEASIPISSSGEQLSSRRARLSIHGENTPTTVLDRKTLRRWDALCASRSANSSFDSNPEDDPDSHSCGEQEVSSMLSSDRRHLIHSWIESTWTYTETSLRSSNISFPSTDSFSSIVVSDIVEALMDCIVDDVA